MYTKQIDSLLNRTDPFPVLHYCNSSSKVLTNQIALAGCYLIVKGKTPDEVVSLYESLDLTNYRDVYYSPYEMPIKHVLEGLYRAVKNEYYPQQYILEDYQRMGLLKNSDMSWIIPNKFIAFSQPYKEAWFRTNEAELSAKNQLHNAAKRLHDLKVEAVVQLNDDDYDIAPFETLGIKHFPLRFPDGGCPPTHIIDKFLEISEQYNVVAVHCLAGLGRTATLIGIYAMKHLEFTAQEFIAWSRLARPGSVLGPQQEFLANYHIEPDAGPISRQARKKLLTEAVEFTDPGQGETLRKEKHFCESDVRGII